MWILTQRLLGPALATLPLSQHGFQASATCTDMIEFVDALLWEHKISMHSIDYMLLQLNLTKVYNSICHQALFNTLANFNLLIEFTTLMADSLTSLTGHIWLNTGLSSQFHVHCGICQGCSLSPLLFTIVLGLKMHVATHMAFSCTLSIAGIRVSLHLEYTNNITLLTQPHSMQYTLDAVASAIALLDLCVSSIKSTLLFSSPQLTLELDDMLIPQADTDSFLILGFWILPDSCLRSKSRHSSTCHQCAVHILALSLSGPNKL